MVPPGIGARLDQALHTVALKYLLAGMAQSGAVLLQTLLDREIIRHLLSAEATCISPAGRLLLRCALVTLRKRKRWVDRQQDDDSGCISHSGPPSVAHENAVPKRQFLLVREFALWPETDMTVRV